MNRCGYTRNRAAAGSYSFYCNKKLPFMKSHRDRGMWGRLVVNEAR